MRHDYVNAMLHVPARYVSLVSLPRLVFMGNASSSVLSLVGFGTDFGVSCAPGPRNVTRFHSERMG